jgi:DNA polymerase I
VLNMEPEIEDGNGKPTKFRTITLRKIGEGTLSTDIYTPSGCPSVSADALKVLAGKIPSEMIYGEANGDTEDILDKVKYGTAYDAFGGAEEGKEACIAIAALCEICSIDSLLSNFIRPLQVSFLSKKKSYSTFDYIEMFQSGFRMA